MIELWLILLAYLSKLKLGVLKPFYRIPKGWERSEINTSKTGIKLAQIKQFHKGDIVEDKKGNVGVVWKVLREIKTNEIVYCSVMWDNEVDGQKVTPLVPIVDLSPKFNPIIRRHK